jgi:hypothetical protein
MDLRAKGGVLLQQLPEFRDAVVVKCLFGSGK